MKKNNPVFSCIQRILRRCWPVNICCFLLLAGSHPLYAQEQKITLAAAIELAVANSPALKLTAAKVAQAQAQYNQVKDQALPTGSASIGFSHAAVPANHIQLGSLDWVLPRQATSYKGGISVQETIFNGFKLKYAKSSTQLLATVAGLEAEKHKDDIIAATIDMYYDLYTVLQTQQVIRQDLTAVDSIIAQAEQLYTQGIVTQNDVLRFKLQRSEVALTAVDLETNRKIVNYNFTVLLGLPEQTQLQPDDVVTGNNPAGQLQQYQEDAWNYRVELKQNTLQTTIAQNDIRSLQGEVLPKLSAGANVNYFHAGSAFIPTEGSFVAPFSVGVTVAWNFPSLWLNKNKIGEARIRQQQTQLSRNVLWDQVKQEVNKCYEQYLRTTEKIKLLEVAVAQAEENDHMQAEKYRSNVTSVTDRIDAGTRLYGTMVNIALAKAEAGLWWFRLKKATGKISK
ncbi:TolC family protein [Chitinophaga nivalis]|uniref:TolC family protein n=1 Tax=Chitinophaga nivalis TaxID=2991709 RepID=A0ABT3IKQ5_9BACT|nr:TolC family protein [Chitinophaga nivalis]MCW3465777.1 TolC family protein [Chitinophaga nivalis]MCW3484532.1 TolC family protein [Chitinophaga nivalis]